MPSIPKKESSDTKKDKNILDNLLKEMQDKFGEGAVMRLGQVRHVEIASIPTGSVSLDIALGVDGIPQGRIIEVYGPESSGKTTLGLQMFLKRKFSKEAEGLVITFEESEADLIGIANKYGFRFSKYVKTVYLPPLQKDIKRLFDKIENIIKTNNVKHVLINSISSITKISTF